MPSIRGISCSILLGASKEKAIERHEIIDEEGDLITVHAQIKDGPFAIDVASAEFVYKRLTVQIEIDGKLQLERNSRYWLTPKDHHDAFAPIDSVIYSNEDGAWVSRCWMFTGVQSSPKIDHSVDGMRLGVIVVRVYRTGMLETNHRKTNDDACTTDTWQRPPAVSASQVAGRSLSHIMTYGQEKVYKGEHNNYTLETEDELAEPYATFVFQYCSQEVLESKLGLKSEDTTCPKTTSLQRVNRLEQRVAFFERIKAKRKVRKQRRADQEKAQKDLDCGEARIATRYDRMGAKEKQMKAMRKEMEVKKKEFKATENEFEAAEKEFKERQRDWEREKARVNDLGRKIADLKKEEAEDNEQLTDMEDEAV